MIKKITHTVIALGLVTLLTAIPAHAQNNNTAATLVPVISLLLGDEDDPCIRVIRPGDVIFDSLDPECPSEGRESGTFAQYFSFTHPGGPLHVDLLNDFPTINGFGLDSFLVLRSGEARDGSIVVEDDNSHENFRGAQIRIDDLAQGRYTLQATARNMVNGGIAHPFNLSVYTNRVTAQATGRLNDTGIAFAGTSLDGNSVSCNGAGDFANQDCNSGRDQNFVLGRRTTSVNDNDGADGFSFLRVAADGAPLRALDENDTPITPNHACVKDNVTGLMWEVKTNNDGLHDADHTYTWYNTNPNENGGFNGEQDGGSCSSNGNCDTQGFVSAVNAAGLCTYNDWRMPTVLELQGILNYNNVSSSENNTLDTNFFPQAQQRFFWSASPDADFTSFAWGVIFDDGSVSSNGRGNEQSVRLVRGGSAQ